MKKIFRWKARILCTALLTFALTATSRGQSPGRPESSDPAFDRYVDQTALAQAWVDKNAPLLTDLGLQLAEGERVLFRTHNKVSSDQVLAMAVKIAVEKRDAKTLERLGKAMESLKKTELSAQIAAAQKLGLASRAPEPSLAVPLEKLSPEAFLLFRDTLDSITAAKIEGDGETLDIIISLTPTLTNLPETQRKYLVKVATQARSSIGDAGVDPVAEAMNKLLEDSRDPRRGGKKEAASLGIKYVPTAKGLRVVDFLEKGPVVLEKGDKLSKGDLILRVGNRACYGNNTNLSAMVESATRSGNRALLVYEAKTRQVRTYQLPAVASNTTAVQTTEPKTEK